MREYFIIPARCGHGFLSENHGEKAERCLFCEQAETKKLRADLAASEIARQELAGQNFNLRAQLAEREAECQRLREAMIKIFSENDSLMIERLAANSLGHSHLCASMVGKKCDCGGIVDKS